MKPLHRSLPALVIGIILLSACGAGGTPQPTSPPESPTQPPVATEAGATEVSIQPTAAETVIALPDLSGPPMEVGSKIQYVDGSILVAVPGGLFIMGHGGEDNPEHEVYVTSFWLYSAEVTNSQFAYCVAMGECTSPNAKKNKGYGDFSKANHPVTGVNYDQAAAYCSFVHGRLPTEAEWEKAARGPDGNIYPWGDASPSCNLENFGTCKFKTTKVTDYPAGQSYYEALDMSGNVHEWVADWYDPKYYSISPAQDPLGPDLGNKRSVRSNAFDSPAYESESARRYANDPILQDENLGFRCVVEAPTYFAPTCTAVMVYGQDAAPGSPGGGGAPSESCPKVGVQVVPLCVNQAGSANVNFSGPPGAVIDAGTCSPTGTPGQYNCLSPTTVSIQADCQQTLPGSPACPPGFAQQGDQCVSQGRPGECLPGYNYDPNSQCCSAAPGQDGSIPLPQCPVGTYYLPGQNVCVPYPAQGIVSAVQSVSIPNCIIPTRSPGGGGGSCPALDCSGTMFPSSWDSTLCCCYNPFKGCQ